MAAFGTGFGAVALRVGVATSADGAAGRFAATEGADVGFTAAIGRAALGAVAELAARAAAAAAIPAAEIDGVALPGVPLVFVAGAAAVARGGALAEAVCNGVVFVADAAGAAAYGGESLDAKSAASIIGETHVPEYAESTGAVAHEPDK
jgi:hypothetical protein